MVGRIGDIRGAAIGGAGRKSRAGGEGFRLPDGAAAAGETESVAAAAPLSLLGLQEDADPRGRDERGAKRGAALLKELGELQADLLRGRRDPERLRRLAALAEGETPADPALAEAVGAVALRAKIELARAGFSDGEENMCNLSEDRL